MEPTKRKKSNFKDNKHRLLREVYRHYIDFQDYYMREGVHTIELNHYPRCDYWLRHERDKNGKPTHAHPNAECTCGLSELGPITISFLDLKYNLNKLSKRKREAFYKNVILDQRQEDVAAAMKVTTVTVGQYVDAACIFLAKRYFAEMEDPEEPKKRQRRKKKDINETL